MDRENFKEALCGTVEAYASVVFVGCGLAFLAMFTTPIWCGILTLLGVIGPENGIAAQATAVLFNFLCLMVFVCHYTDKLIKNKVLSIIAYFVIMAALLGLLMLFVNETLKISTLAAVIIGFVNIGIVVILFLDWLKNQ